MTASRFLNSREVQPIYLHEDSVPNMAGSTSWFKNNFFKKEEKKEGRKSKESVPVRVKRWADYTAGVMKPDNAVRAVSSCQILLMSFSFLPVNEKQGLRQHPTLNSCFWKSTRQRKANVALLGCSEARLGSSRGRTGCSGNKEYCNLQPCCSSKTIAGLMHTLDDVRDTAQTDCAAWARGSRGFRGAAQFKGEFLCHKMHKTKITYTFPLLKSSSSCDTRHWDASNKFKYWLYTN